MKKYSLISVLVMLVLGILPVSATSLADLTALAAYFPANTPIFAAVRTDAGLVQQLDQVVATVGAKLPPGALPPDASVRSLLNQAVQQATGQDFAASIRPWLGDTAAFGITRVETLAANTPQVLVAVQITDKDAVMSFVTQMMEREGRRLRVIENANWTVLTPPRAGNFAIALQDDIMLIADRLVNLPVSGYAEGTLADDVDFQETLAMFPAPEYNALAYIDTAAIMSRMGPQAEIPGFNAAMLATLVGKTALAFTILDGRSLTIDLVANTGDLRQLSALGLMAMDVEPVDLGFAAEIPADSSLVLHATGLQMLVDNLIANMRLTESRPGEVDAGLEQIAAVIMAATGLDLQEDILGWMTGDYALFVSYDVPELIALVTTPDSVPPELPVDFGLVIEATDPAKARAFVDGINAMLMMANAQSPDLTISQEQIAGADVIVLNQPLPMGDQAMSLSIVIGANDRVFTIATRPAAKIILSEGGGLDTAPAYTEASRYFLNEPTAVWYTDADGAGGGAIVVGLAMLGPAIGPVFDNIVDELSGTPTPDELARREQERLRREEANRQYMLVLQSLTSIMTSSSVTSTFQPETGMVMRMVVTLAE